MSAGTIALLPLVAAGPMLMMFIFRRGRHAAAHGSVGGCGHGHGQETQQPHGEPIAEKGARPEDEPEAHRHHGSGEEPRPTTAGTSRRC